MAARDDRPLGQRVGQRDGVGDTGLVARGGSGRRTLGPSSPVRQVVPHSEPAAAGPLVADLRQQWRLPATASAVCEHDHAYWGAVGLLVGLVRDSRNLIKVHEPSLNSADTGP